jgi:hypothetical protein
MLYHFVNSLIWYWYNMICFLYLNKCMHLWYCYYDYICVFGLYSVFALRFHLVYTRWTIRRESQQEWLPSRSIGNTCFLESTQNHMFRFVVILAVLHPNSTYKHYLWSVDKMWLISTYMVIVSVRRNQSVISISTESWRLHRRRQHHRRILSYSAVTMMNFLM